MVQQNKEAAANETPSFSTELATKDVMLTIAGGVKVPSYVSEMGGDDLEAFMDGVSGHVDTEATDDGHVKVKIKMFRGLYKELLARCLYKKEGNVRWTTEEIGRFPQEIQAALYDIAASVNHLVKPKVGGPDPTKAS